MWSDEAMHGSGTLVPSDILVTTWCALMIVLFQRALWVASACPGLLS